MIKIYNYSVSSSISSSSSRMGLFELVQPDHALATRRRTFHTVLLACAPHMAAVSVTVTPDHFQEFIWSWWQVGEYWRKFSITLLPSPFQRPNFVTTSFPLGSKLGGCGIMQQLKWAAGFVDECRKCL